MTNPVGGVQFGAKSTGPIGLDLMLPGNGTPWEDRGTMGAAKAYVLTTIKSIVSPGLLLDHISRPNTTADGTAYAMVSGAMWIVGVIALRVWQYMSYDVPKPKYDVDGFYFTVTSVGICALVAGAIWLYLNTFSGMYSKLAASEMRNATPALVYNIFCYCLGPSIFALVPIYGQGLALLLIFFNLFVAGRKRLYLSGASAFVNALLVALSGAALAVATYFVLGWFWGSYMEMSGVTERHVRKSLPALTAPK